MKLCSKCKCELTELNVNKGDSKCRICRKAYRNEYYAKNKVAEIERNSQWRQKNAERSNEYKRIHWENISPEKREHYLKKRQEHNFKSRYGDLWEVANKSLSETPPKSAPQSPKEDTPNENATADTIKDTGNNANGKITMKTLRNELWDSIQKMKQGNLEPATADAITRGCNGIMRSYRLELDVAKTFGADNMLLGLEEEK